MHDVSLDEVDTARKSLRSWQRDKGQGKVRALGLSTHSAQVAALAADWLEAEVLMVPINPTGICTPDTHIEDGSVKEMIEATQRAWKMGKGIVAMKVMGCGTLAADPPAAISFVTQLACVHSLCIGMRNLNEIRDNIRLLALAEEQTGSIQRTGN